MAKKKILIVENDYHQYYGLKSFFVLKGFTVLQLSDDEPIGSYNDALNILRSEIPDIAILDIELDGAKDGIDLAEYLQPLNIPVIFLTGHANDQNLERARQILPNGLISKTEKPYDEQQLWNAVCLALEYVERKRKRHYRGISLKVREVSLEEPLNSTKPEYESERIGKERLFEWDEIIFFYTGKDTKHNYIIVRTDNSGRIGYEFKESLAEFEKIVPANFVRVNRNYLVNAYKITEHDLPRMIIIDKLSIFLTDYYRDSATKKIKIIRGL